MKKLIMIALLFSLSAFASVSRVYDTQSKSFISYETFLANLNSNGFIVLGEIHNVESIQNTQAKIISDTVSKSELSGDFTVMWEFLNYRDDQKNKAEYEKLLANKIDAVQFIKNTAGERNLAYAPIFETARKLNGHIAGLNEYRSVKSEIIKGGLTAIDPKLVPPNMEVGGEDYWARFEAIMGGHVPPAKLERYFLAQCYTDSVMSYIANQRHKTNLSFIIAGSFHTDYFDGTVSRLKKLTNESITTVSLRDITDYTDEEIQELISESPEFGVLAHYIILTK